MYAPPSLSHVVPPDLLLMHPAAGAGLQTAHVCPGQLPALIRQVFKGGVFTRGGCKQTETPYLNLMDWMLVDHSNVDRS